MKRFLLPCICLFLFFLSGLARAQPRYNVLFISVDDLRPELGCYGSTAVQSPHIDRLADQGVLFSRAYCQEAICHASRASLFTGMYPVSKNGYNFRGRVDQGLPDTVTLPELFKHNGYTVIGINKDFHHYHEEKKHWTEHFESPTPNSDWRNYVTKENQDIQQRRLREELERDGENSGFHAGRLPPANLIEIAPDELAVDYIDNHGTTLAIAKLNELKDRPFFLAMGYRRPHMPFNAPESVFARYPLDQIEVPDNMFNPTGVSRYAFMNSVEMRAYVDIPEKGPVAESDQRVKEILQGYYASVSYVDDQVGRLLDALDRLGLRENTIVILWGDHGFKLGEHDEWGKHANFEVDVQAPLILSVPGVTKPGSRTEALTEFVDIYPTLAGLCGLELPPQLEGKSLLPLIEGTDPVHRDYAFSQFPRKSTVVGYTVRLDSFRYTEWRNPETGELLAHELFDHTVDPEENRNLAEDPDYARKVELGRRLISGKLDWIRHQRK